jgi:RNA polymerase sigma factor (sigma-70 family)
MEVSALKYSGGIGLHGRSPLLRLQSDERLIAYLRKGNTAAFEVLLSRYETRLLAFCRHLLGSREDAEDVLQEVMTAAFNAILADERPINVRPWLYRIARNRSLNHLRRASAIGVDTMDTHFSDHGASTADKVHEREEFRLLVGDIHELPETQKTALVLREMDALSYEQIAEAMETTVSSVKSLLVRARVSLAEAAEARLLSCDEVRIELGEVAEGLKRRPGPLVRRHLRQCKRCSVFRSQLRQTNKALAALMPIGPFIVLKKLAIFHLGHSAASGSAAGTGAVGSAGAGAAGVGAAGVGAAGAGAGAAGAGAGAAGAGAGAAGMGAAASGGALAGSGGFISAGLTAIATKAAAGLAAAALVTAGAVEADHSATVHHPSETEAAAPVTPAAAAAPAAPLATHVEPRSTTAAVPTGAHPAKRSTKTTDAALKPTTTTGTTSTAAAPTATASTKTPNSTKTIAGRDQTQTDPTVLQGTGSTSGTPTAPTSPAPTGSMDGSGSAGSSSTSTGSSPSDSGSAGSSSGAGSAGSGSTGSSGSGSGTLTGPTGVGTVTSPTGTTISPSTTTGSTSSSTNPGPTTGPAPTLTVPASAARPAFRALLRGRRRLAWR